MTSAPAVPALRAVRRHGVLSVALSLAFGLKLAVVLCAVNRGFELGDEGYFLLNLNHPEAALPPLEIYRVLGLLRGGAEIGVIGARVLRIAAELTGSVALIAGVFAWARARVFPAGSVSASAFTLLCLQGTLLSVASRSLGYNDLTNLFTYSAVGCLFQLAALPADAGRARTVLAVGAGLLTGCQLAAKFPPAILLAVGACLVLGLGVRARSPRERLRLVGRYAAGVLAAVAFVVLATGGAAGMKDRLAVAAQLPALTGYDPLALIVRYVVADVWTEVNLGLFLLVFAGAVGWGLRGPAARVDRVLAGSLQLAALVLVVSVWGLHPHFLHGSLVYLAVLLVGLPLVLLRRAPRWRRPPGGAAEPAGSLALLLVLLGLPFVMIAGTNVPVTMRMPMHVLPLFVALAVLVLDLRARCAGGRFHATVVVTLVTLSSVVFIQHHVRKPYGLRQPIYEQRSAVEGLPGVRVDLATQSFLEAMAASMAEAGFQRGDPVIAFDYMPGLVFYLGGTSPRYNLYMFDQPALNCFNANQVDRATPPFVILGRPMSELQRDCLEAIRVPDDYRLIRTLRFPYQSVYAGFGADGFSHVTLYAPRQLSRR